MANFQPFSNASQSVGLTSDVGELTLENQGQQVNLYGNATFTIDKESLALARQLQQVMGDIVAFLEKNHAETIAYADVVKAQQANVSEVDNPFA